MTKTVQLRHPQRFFGNTELGVISVDSNWIVVSGVEGGSRTRTSFRTTDLKSRDSGARKVSRRHLIPVIPISLCATFF
jgi:hypothetical protein